MRHDRVIMAAMHRSASGILATLLALAAASAAAQSVERGALLTAMPQVGGYAFERTVVLIVHHADNGSLGIIMNRPTELSPAETFDGLAALGDYDGRVFIGGPVEPARPLMLVNDTRDDFGNLDRVLGTVRVTADPARVSSQADRLTDESRLRVFAGHVQWEPGQLESEVAEGAWRVHAGSVDAVFAEAPLSLYGTLAPAGADEAEGADGAQTAARAGTPGAGAVRGELSRAP